MDQPRDRLGAREIDPDFGQGTLSLLAQIAPGGPPESAFVASLLGELPRLGEAPTVLVLDDFHAVDDSAEARGFLARLIKDAPPWLHFVISTRRRPALELGRLAAMGEVAEITTDELRFTGDETERLFAQGYGLALDAGRHIRHPCAHARAKSAVGSLRSLAPPIAGSGTRLRLCHTFHTPTRAHAREVLNLWNSRLARWHDCGCVRQSMQIAQRYRDLTGRPVLEAS